MGGTCLHREAFRRSRILMAERPKNTRRTKHGIIRYHDNIAVVGK